MSIQKETVALIHYTLKDNQGELIDSSEGQEPLAYIHGVGQLIPGLEKELEGKVKGDKLSVTIKPEDAYGVRSDELIQDVALSNFDDPKAVQQGVQFQMQSGDSIRIATVVEVKGETVVIDLNHPLAGIELNFDVEVISTRPATAEELDHGHVHGEGGHSH